MLCPRDASELESFEYVAGVTVDGCPSCGGIWLDRGELESIEDSRLAGRGNLTAEITRMPDLVRGAYDRAIQRMSAPVSCPSCGMECETGEYAYCSQVTIDRCPSCGGIWLDKGELETLELFCERSRLGSMGLRLAFFKSLIRDERG